MEDLSLILCGRCTIWRTFKEVCGVAGAARGGPHKVVRTEKADEWNVPWQVVSVHAAHVEAVTDYFVAEVETDRNALTYDTKWTPVKRLHAMRDSTPEEARSSVAWSGTFLRWRMQPCDGHPCDESDSANDAPC